MPAKRVLNADLNRMFPTSHSGSYRMRIRDSEGAVVAPTAEVMADFGYVREPDLDPPTPKNVHERKTQMGAIRGNCLCGNNVGPASCFQTLHDYARQDGWEVVERYLPDGGISCTSTLVCPRCLDFRNLREKRW